MAENVWRLTMADEHSEQRRPHASPLLGPYVELDIAREVEQLRREGEWRSGHNAKTLAKYDGLRIVLIALKAGSTIPPHHTEGQISIQNVAGHIRVHADGRTFDLRAGGLLVLDHGLPHDVKAFEDSAFLLTIAWPAGTGQPAA
jgi:quercetin dioxygenase-like cupin family protein